MHLKRFDLKLGIHYYFRAGNIALCIFTGLWFLLERTYFFGSLPIIFFSFPAVIAFVAYLSKSSKQFDEIWKGFDDGK